MRGEFFVVVIGIRLRGRYYAMSGKPLRRARLKAKGKWPPEGHALSTPEGRAKWGFPRKLSKISREWLRFVGEEDADLAEELRAHCEEGKPLEEGSGVGKEISYEQAVQETFRRLGGPKAMMAFALQNPGLFMTKMVAPMLPKNQKLEMTVESKEIGAFDEQDWARIQGAVEADAEESG